MNVPHRITQHKRFVPCGTHLNFCFVKTSFTPQTLCAIGRDIRNDTEPNINLITNDIYR